jgi:hypothetical protein
MISARENDLPLSEPRDRAASRMVCHIGSLEVITRSCHGESTQTSCSGPGIFVPWDQRQFVREVVRSPAVTGIPRSEHSDTTLRNDLAVAVDGDLRWLNCVKFPAPCRSCGVFLAVGRSAWWSPSAKELVCLKCGPSRRSTSPPSHPEAAKDARSEPQLSGTLRSARSSSPRPATGTSGCSHRSPMSWPRPYPSGPSRSAR